MKKTLKLFGSLIMTLALVFAMALTSGAAEPAEAASNYTIPDTQLKINGVANGDTIAAYQLVGYKNDSYNDYQFNSNFESFINTKKSEGMTAESYLEGLNGDALANLLGEYATACKNATYNLPDASASQTATADESVTLSLRPGYYLLLGATTSANGKVYKPMSAFIQVKGGENVNVYGGGSQLTATEGVYVMNAKSESGPVIDKQVYDNRVTEGNGWKDAASASVGDTLDFYVKVEIPAYTGVTNVEMTLNDTLTNLEYIDGSATVYNTIGSGNEFSNLIENAVTVKKGVYANGTQSVTFTLDYSKVKGNGTGNIVYVKYQAKMKEEAASAKQGSNSVTLTYKTSMDSTSTKTPSETTNVYTYALGVEKTDTNHKKLTGAKFTLYSDAACTNVLTFTKVGDGTDAYYRPAVAGETGVTELDADFLIRGLNVGVYYMKETVVPTGYYAPKGAFKVTLTAARGETTNTLTGVLTTGCSIVSENDSDRLLVEGIGVNTADTSRYDARVLNSATPILPSTGGAGTVLFTIVGVALMVLAVWLFFFRGKKTAK